MGKQITNNMTYPAGRKLFILGDSFAACRPGTESAPTWHRLAADLLSQHHGEPVHLINSSLIGSAQDFCWGILQEWFWNEAIGPDDYLIVALTHPSRYWFLERLPELTNVNIIDLDRHVSKEEATAIELFIKHIQRPNLDTMMLINRMAYLALMVSEQKLHRPLMINCFNHVVGAAEGFEELNWAKGNLFEDIQRDEFSDKDREVADVFWRGLDGRFNHMCLSNHKILAEKIVTALTTDSTLDITSGFIKKIIPEDWETDIKFQQTELDYEITLRNLDNRKQYKSSLLPWKNRRGITTNNK